MKAAMIHSPWVVGRFSRILGGGEEDARHELALTIERKLAENAGRGEDAPRIDECIWLRECERQVRIDRRLFNGFSGGIGSREMATIADAKSTIPSWEIASDAFGR